MRSVKFAVAALVVALAALACSATVLAATSSGNVLVCAVDDEAYGADVQAKLEATGRFSAVDLFDCGTGTPTPAQLAGYSAVLVYSDAEFADPVTLGNELADYVDGGGHVVEATFNFDSTYSGGYLEGRWLDGGYGALQLGAGQSDYQSGDYQLVADQPSSPLLAGVGSFDGGASSYRQFGVTLAPGATLIAHWNDEASTPLEAEGPHSIALNLFPPSSDVRSDLWDASTDGATLIANALAARPAVVVTSTSFPHIAVCTKKPVYRAADGSYGLFADVDVHIWDAGKNNPSSPYYQASPAVYVQGYGLMCGLSDVATYGGDPAAFTLASYNVDLTGMQAPAGETDADAGAYYAFFAKK